MTIHLSKIIQIEKLDGFSKVHDNLYCTELLMFFLCDVYYNIFLEMYN